MPRAVNSTASPRTATAARAQALHMIAALRDAPEALRPSLLAGFRSGDPDVFVELVGTLLDQQREAQHALEQADRALSEHQQIIENLTRPPLIEAGVVALNLDGTVLVSLGGHSRQEVGVHPDVDFDELQVGDTVGLAQDGHVVVKRLGHAPRGRVATVQGWQNGELLVEYQPEHRVTATPAAAVAEAGPRPGDRVLVHEGWHIAMAMLPRDEADERDDPFEPVRPDQIGGLDDQIDEILTAVEARLLEPERAEELGIEPLGGLILAGPPGTGKTLLARALATFLSEHRGVRVKFINVAPGSWRDPYYGVSDHKVVEPIRRARRLIKEGTADLVILFYDEIDTLGARSAEVTSRIDSRVLSALLSEMDGVSDRAERRGMLFIGATNRTDLIDEALLRPGRFGGLVVNVPRPDREAARAILRCHVSPSHRYHNGGEEVSPEEMAGRCVEAAVARLFRDAEPSDALAELVLAGGQRRHVYGGDVLSGAVLASVAQRARRLALRRGLFGPRGLTPDDFARAADDELDSIAERLRDPFKVREILDDRALPVTQGIPRRRRRD